MRKLTHLLVSVVSVSLICATLITLGALAQGAAPAPKTMVVTLEGLRLRAEPSLVAEVLLALHRGELVTVLDEEPVIAEGVSWTHVSVERPNGSDVVTTKGYCSTYYLREALPEEIAAGQSPKPGKGKGWGKGGNPDPGNGHGNANGNGNGNGQGWGKGGKP